MGKWNRSEVAWVLIILVVIAGIVWAFWDYFPGTLRQDAQGERHGTGVQRYFYQSGKLMLEERYRAGRLMRSTWYDPTGKEIQQTDWINGAGEGIYLREDGSIRKRVPYRNGLAEGKAISYAPDGTVESEIWYSQGKRVSPPDIGSAPQ
jgi:antitoxin component YwqK of YwqJK toxin-antitoxin module